MAIGSSVLTWIRLRKPPWYQLYALQDLPGHVFDGEGLARRQADVGNRAPAALVDGRGEHDIQPISRDHEVAAERGVAVDERSGAGQHPVELGEDGPEVILAEVRRSRVV